MTGSNRRGDTPMGPPWPVDVLADLHAGVFDEAPDLLPRARQDPDARAVLDALDATRAELGGLTARQAPPMPERFAARLDAAIAAEARAMFPAARMPDSASRSWASRPDPSPPNLDPASRSSAPMPDPASRSSGTGPQFRQPVTAGQGPAAPVVDLAAARKRRNQRVGWGVGTLVAAAAVAVAVIAIPHGKPALNGVAAPPPSSTGAGAAAGGPQALTGGDLNTATLAAALGRNDYGPLSDPNVRAACLAANGADPDRTPAGAMRVTLDGKPGILMVLTTGKTAQFRLLVVGPDCAAGHPDRLADSVVGGLTPTTR